MWFGCGYLVLGGGWLMMTFWTKATAQTRLSSPLTAQPFQGAGANISYTNHFEPPLSLHWKHQSRAEYITHDPYRGRGLTMARANTSMRSYPPTPCESHACKYIKEHDAPISIRTPISFLEPLTCAMQLLPNPIP